jgi:membrane protein YqaA with SNARE-associated domain
MGFGGIGLFAVAVVDSSIIPLPLPGSTDLLLLLLVAHRANAVLMAAIAIVGSIIGGYQTWSAGVKGGEAAIHRYVPARWVERLDRWVKNRGTAAVVIASLLPPPLPILPFLLAAGALGVPWRKFLVAYGSARTVRYSLEAVLAATYGRKIVRLWSGYLDQWGPIVIGSFVALMIAATLFGVWRWKRAQQPAPSPSFSRS